MVIGHLSLVIGHWSLVIGHWSLVIGHWSLTADSTEKSAFLASLNELSGRNALRPERLLKFR
ncbi:MAG: hypothetical protein ACSI46_24045 [Gloeotrichia echinulata DVL01]